MLEIHYSHEYIFNQRKDIFAQLSKMITDKLQRQFHEQISFKIYHDSESNKRYIKINQKHQKFLKIASTMYLVSDKISYINIQSQTALPCVIDDMFKNKFMQQIQKIGKKCGFVIKLIYFQTGMIINVFKDKYYQTQTANSGYYYLINQLNNISELFDQIYERFYQLKNPIQTNYLKDPYEQTQDDDYSFQQLKQLSLIPQQKQIIFKNFQKIQKILIRNPINIENNKNQVLGQVKFKQKLSIQQINLTNGGAYSKIYRITGQGQLYDTYRDSRNGDIQQKSYPKKIQKKCVLSLVIKKANQKESANNSFENEIKFLNLVGSNKNPFICNYYIQTNKNNQLYMEYHQKTICNIFFQKPKYIIKISDFLNFTEQLLKGLQLFYFQKGFLHRDIKPGNLLLSKQGIIKIIDNGSIYNFQSQNKPNYNNFLEIYDKTLRSTYYVDRKIFQKNQYLKNKYKLNYQQFKSKNSVHKTFDVYSVGILLKYIYKNNKSLYFGFKIQEIKGYIYNLIHKMTKQNFQQRITLQQSIGKIQDIRKKIFQNK